MSTTSQQGRLSMPRRFAIHLLHQAQLAGEQPFTGVVGAGAEPDSYAPLLDGAGLEQALELLNRRERCLWAVYLHRPGQPPEPTPQDYAEQPQAPRLTSSLATKGVLQLRAWVLDGGRVVERELQLSD